MSLNDRCTLSQLVANFMQTRRLPVILGVSLLLGIGGCETVPSWMNSRSSTPVELSIQQINPGTSGSYTVSGSTTLPNRTQITVYAVRYFSKTDDIDANTALNPARRDYAILDRQIADVNQGAWQTKLNVQTLTDGQLQESWQRSVAPSRLTPEPEVTFLAALEPVQQPRTLQTQIEAQAPAAITRFTTDGELYLQAVKTLAVPVEGTVQPVAFNPPRPVQVKVAEVPEGQPVQQPQTDLPIPPEALFR